jgi:hypothetical protein
MHQLNVKLGEHNDIVSLHDKLHEFSMHTSADMNISLLYFFDFFTWLAAVKKKWRRLGEVRRAAAS